MNWLKKFMAGRYGGDQLSIFLVIVSLILTIVGQITQLLVLAYLGYIPIILAFYRMLSKDTSKRSMENYKFAIMMSPLYAWFKKVQGRVKNRKTHKYFKCVKCNAQLRVPKGRGKIVITCPKCKEKFSKKS
ncbi:hypothetical protein PRVXH_001277 [Proteinivorax hydrogeniformans]|uniref:Zn-finger containing protein n=1 Tax=Proteinivorax hydrogeniformans TaxID=1826727 RepID=A0AAU8HX49_9FIRM